jgi:hypothetical protein
MLMAITNQTRPEDLLITWRRQEDGSLATVASFTNVVEEVDDGTSPPTYTAIRHTLAAELATADVIAMVGDQLPALSAERDALQDQLTQAQADKQTALDAQATAEASLAEMTAARDTLQAQLDAIQNPPIPHVISQRFKIAMDQLVPGLLKTVDDWVATQPVATQLRWNYPEFYRNDEMLTETAGLIVGMVPNLPTNDPAALLDQIFALAKTLP